MLRKTPVPDDGNIPWKKVGFNLQTLVILLKLAPQAFNSMGLGNIISLCVLLLVWGFLMGKINSPFASNEMMQMHDKNLATKIGELVDVQIDTKILLMKKTCQTETDIDERLNCRAQVRALERRHAAVRNN